MLIDDRDPTGCTLPPAPITFACEANSRTMSPPTSENTPHLGAGSRYGPTPAATAADGPADRPLPATAPPAQEHQWPPTPDPGDRSHAHPLPSPTAPLELAGSSTSALATLPEVLTAREAAAILRVGRNQLYQAVARGELGAVRIGRTIRIPKHALLDLLATASPPPAHGDD
jgi:excisionase family DNA binding protein